MDTAERDGHRLDAFVDAAFAFAVSLLIVAGGEAPSSISDLYANLARMPAFAMGFALITMFWLGHRAFGRLVPRRDNLVVVVSLAIVFMVLVYVPPLQMLASTASHFLSGGRLPGGDLVRSASDMQAIFIVYGLGFSALSGLFWLLFRHGARNAEALGADEVGRAKLEEWKQSWIICAGTGVISALLAQLFPGLLFLGLPGFAYWLIPISLGLLAWRQRRMPVVAPDDT